MEKKLSTLCSAIKELNSQESATHTIHQVLYTVKHNLNPAAAVVVLKNDKTDYLEIVNRYNVSETFTNQFKRGIGSSAVGKVFYEQQVVVTRFDGDANEYKDLFLEADYHTCLAVRIEADGRPMGYMAMYFNEAVTLDEDMKEMSMALAMICAEAVSKESATEQLNKLRCVDTNIGTLHYNFFLQKFKDEFSKSLRYKIPLSLIIMDMDNFKDVMNLYGTDTAHHLYVELSNLLMTCIRGVDILSRYGTDEFILYLPSTDMEHTVIVISRFMEKVVAGAFTDKEVKSSISAGISSIKPGDTLDAMMRRAQVAIYKAKVEGKGLLKTVE
jgi:diguanylate cyclase (GGDEF)-like protein